METMQQMANEMEAFQDDFAVELFRDEDQESISVAVRVTRPQVVELFARMLKISDHAIANQQNNQIEACKKIRQMRKYGDWF